MLKPKIRKNKTINIERKFKECKKKSKLISIFFAIECFCTIRLCPGSGFVSLNMDPDPNFIIRIRIRITGLEGIGRDTRSSPVTPSINQVILL